MILVTVPGQYKLTQDHVFENKIKLTAGTIVEFTNYWAGQVLMCIPNTPHKMWVVNKLPVTQEI